MNLYCFICYKNLRESIETIFEYKSREIVDQIYDKYFYKKYFSKKKNKHLIFLYYLI